MEPATPAAPFSADLDPPKSVPVEVVAFCPPRNVFDDCAGWVVVLPPPKRGFWPPCVPPLNRLEAGAEGPAVFKFAVPWVTVVGFKLPKMPPLTGGWGLGRDDRGFEDPC